MATNLITIELAAEDRARIDKLIEVLFVITEGTELIEVDPAQAVHTMPPVEKQPEPIQNPSRIEPQAYEVPAPTNNTPKVEIAPEPTTEPITAPAVTLEQIQQKVLHLATSNGGAKKAQVRAIIQEYGAKVSDLEGQPDKWGEVWSKLTTLESGD